MQPTASEGYAPASAEASSGVTAGTAALAGPTPGLSVLAREMRTGWVPRCAALVLGYVLIAYVVSGWIGQPVAWLVRGMVHQATKIALLAYLPLLLAYVCKEALHLRRAGRLADFLFSRRFHVEFLVAIVAVHVTVMMYSNLKQFIPVANERLYDSQLWRIDAWLHLGIAPAYALTELAGTHGWLHTLDRAYVLFFLAQLFVPLGFLLSSRLRPLRGRFFFAYCLIWMLGGAIAMLWPTLGPVYYRPNQFVWLDDAPVARMLQGMLMEDYSAFRSAPATYVVKSYYGIAAMPSLHVGLIALFALASWRVRWMSICLWLLTLVTFVGSMALGWHYAVDGYAGVLVAWIAWRIASRAVAVLPAESPPLVSVARATLDRRWRASSISWSGAQGATARLAGLVFLAGVAVYANTLHNRFAFDDNVQIVQNLKIRHLTDSLEIFREQTWPGSVYRPLPTWSYALTYAVVKLDPWLYHLTNVVLHGLVSVLVFLSLRALFAPTLALVAAFLFAIDPIHVEAVANLANRTELMMSFFGMLCLTWALVQRGPIRVQRRSLPWLTGVAVAFLLAMLSKESALCFLLLVPLCLCFRRGIAAGLRDSIAPVAFMCLGAAVYFALRIHVLGGILAKDTTPPFYDNPLIVLRTGERMLNAIVLLGRYVGLTLFPWSLSADYSYARITAIENFLAPSVLLDLGLLAGLVGLTVYGLRKRSGLAFWGLWFAASFAVTANLLMPIGVIFAERLAFLPSVGVCGLLAWGLLGIRDHRLRLASIAAVALFFVVRTELRDADWFDDSTLFRREVELSSANARMHNNLGVQLLKANQVAAAREHFVAALAIYPTYAQAAYGISVTEVKQGHVDEATQWLGRALEMDAHHAPSLNLLGRIYLSEGKVDDAGRLFVRALNWDNDDYDAMLGVMEACMRRGNLDQARVIHAQLAARDPENPELIAAGRELGGQL
ncbi:MAG TPA: phosphatase PAP2 family protein [Candidatus Bathyarchaeia archaeon]|nr:phosphatase PAP2 family protein [Candidatus Bathyarchaeia archaeon]